MNFSVRVTTPFSGSVAGLAARMRVAAQAGRRDEGDATAPVGLPSTSNIRDPAEISALSRFEEPLADVP